MSKKRAVILISFEDLPGLHDALDRYRKSKGWTWKRLFLVGAAEAINSEHDNDDMLLEIVDYLENRR